MLSSTTNPLLEFTSTLLTAAHTHTLILTASYFILSLFDTGWRGRQRRCGRSKEPTMWNSAKNAFATSASFREDLDDEEALRWAALERLPTYSRARRGIFKDITGEKKEVDVSDLEAQERILVLDRLDNSVGDDPEKFFNEMRSRFDK